MNKPYHMQYTITNKNMKPQKSQDILLPEDHILMQLEYSHEKNKNFLSAIQS